MVTKTTHHKKQLSVAETPILRLKVKGPGVRGGRISVPDLIKLCQESQNAVKRQAEAFEGRKTIHPGPTTRQIRHECTLDLVAIRKGSTTLDFALTKPQMNLPFEETGEFAMAVVQELAESIKSLGDNNQKSDIDPGVLNSIYAISSVISAERITGVEWIVPSIAGKRQISATVNNVVRERAAKRLSTPLKVSRQIDGILDMADFKPRDSKCRIDPAVGASVICSFGPEHESQIQSLLRRPVRVRGLATIQPLKERIDSLELESIEPLPSLALGEGNFFASPSIQQLIEAQRLRPLRDISSLAGLIDDSEIDDFVAGIYEARKSL